MPPHFQALQSNRCKESRLCIKKTLVLLFVCTVLSSGCSYNPFIRNNHTTGSATGAIVGAGIGVGGVALLNGSKPAMALAGIGGGMLGYYVTTLRYAAGGVIQAGGQVYQVGDFIGIDIPSDRLFEVNTANFLPTAGPVLDSAANVLKRYPRNNVFISGNTSGFSSAVWERKLSEKRAQRVSSYLWKAGINAFKEPGTDTRKLGYSGLDHFFPIASDYTNDGIRQNSHIQITSYPSQCDLYLDKRHLATQNVGGEETDNDIDDAPTCTQDEINRGGCFTSSPQTQ